MSIFRHIVKSFFRHKTRAKLRTITYGKPKAYSYKPEYSRNQNFGRSDRRSKNSYTSYTAEEMQKEFAILDAGVGRTRK